jgi:hypothetical protein
LKIDNIDVDSAIAFVKNLLEKERDLSPSLKAALEVLLVLVALLVNRTTLNSKKVVSRRQRIRTVKNLPKRVTAIENPAYIRGVSEPPCSRSMILTQ